MEKLLRSFRYDTKMLLLVKNVIKLLLLNQTFVFQVLSKKWCRGTIKLGILAL